jgi:YD repeat-containing protein
MVYERELDAAGRTVARRALRPDAAGVPVLERDERWSYDAAGRVTEVAHSADWVERFEYDAQGRLVRHLWDYGSDASYNGAEETNYDARGRWISVVNLVNGDVTATRTRTFACE